MKKFKCPKCGGSNFGKMAKFIPDTSFPPIKSYTELERILTDGRTIIFGGRLVDGGIKDSVPDEEQFLALMSPPQILLEIDFSEIRCHSATDGKPMSGRKDRYKPCGFVSMNSDDPSLWTD